MTRTSRFWTAKHRARVIARALACSALLVLPSCRIPWLRSPEPAHPLPTEFNIATHPEVANPLAAVVGGLGVANLGPVVAPPAADSSGQLGVEEFYQDPLLTTLILQGLANNRELKILDEEVRIARNDILARRGAYLPFVTVGGRVGLDKPSLYTPIGAAENQLLYPPGRRFPDPLGDFVLGLNFAWTPDVFRFLHKAMYAAQERYLAALERRNDFVTRLISDTAENYYKLMALDQKIVTLDQTIALQQQSYEIALARKEAGRATELPVQRFIAEIRKNESEKFLVRQEIIEVENRINFLVYRAPQPVLRPDTGFYDLTIHALSAGLPSQLLLNRPDIRQAEHEMAAAGLDVQVARGRFFPAFTITSGFGFQAFNLKYLFMSPDAMIANVVGDVVAPLINRAAIKADYLTANARQLESVYNYQRVVLNAVTEVVNRMTMVENYRKSIEIKKQQLAALEASVDVASKLFQNARAEYVEVLLAQRDMLEARTVLIETKQQQLAAVVNAYQALGGGSNVLPEPAPAPTAPPHPWWAFFHHKR